MQPSLSVVTGRFPNVRDQAARLFDDDDDFRELCEEYRACSETVCRLEGGGSSSEAMRNEYKVLLLRLEGELLRYLAEHPRA
jgi:hypothetical protein